MQSRECVKATSDREVVYKYTACACVRSTQRIGEAGGGHVQNLMECAADSGNDGPQYQAHAEDSPTDRRLVTAAPTMRVRVAVRMSKLKRSATAPKLRGRFVGFAMAPCGHSKGT